VGIHSIDIDTMDCDISGFPSLSSAMEDYVIRVLDELEIEECEISLVLCSEAFIRELNSRYRGKDEPTDVLSFSQNEGYDIDEYRGEGVFSPLFGDIVISFETVRRQANTLAVSEGEELKRVVLHGILHLLGMDHQTNEEEEPMLKKQEDLLTQLSEVHLF